jgi:hypothetical protein
MIRWNAFAIISALPLALPWHVDAADPLACVDRDVAQTLLLGPDAGGPEITREWSPRLPRIPLPHEFQLIGSRTLRFTAVVALESTLAPDEAQTKLLAAMDAANWRALQTRTARASEPSVRSGGFRPPTRGATRAGDRLMFCNDDEGMMTAWIEPARGDSSYIRLVSTREYSRMQCYAQGSPRGPRATGRGDLPDLVIPEAAIVSDSSQVGGGSQTMWEESAHVVIQAPLAADELIAHFTRQLNEQGWRRDAEWHAGPLYGSGWSSRDGSVAGLMTVVLRGSDLYDTRFETMRFKDEPR